MLVLKFPRLRIPPSFLFGAKHFGTGVLVATAFVHLLPTAFDSLGDPCLSSFWTTDYQAMPGAIMLASVFFVTLIEMIFSPARHVCGGNEGVAAVSRQTQEPKAETKQQPDTPPPALERTDSNSSLRVRDLGALKGRVGSISRTLSRYREDGQRLDAIESVEGSESEEAAVAHRKLESDDHVTPPDHEKGEHGHLLSPEQIHRKAIMQVFLLEMGILFHSIFIGMSLAVSVGNDFTVLLIAIVFHREIALTLLHRLYCMLTDTRQKPLKVLHLACALQTSNGSPKPFSHGSWLSPMAARTSRLSLIAHALYLLAAALRAAWPLASQPTRCTLPIQKSASWSWAS